MTITDDRLIDALIAWLERRGMADSGISYERNGRNGRGIPRVELTGSDATFIRDNFHGKGASELHAALVALRQSSPPDGQTSDGWIEWKGGECPVPGRPVDYRMRNGVGWAEDASRVQWRHRGDFADIIAYRVATRSLQAGAQN